jgi:uncharacterized protein YdcH (DUF465 family)
MGIANLAIIALVVLAGVGVFSIWGSGTGGGSGTRKPGKEGFEATPAEDADIDYFVAVSSAINKHRGVDPSTSEVRRTVAEMKKKKVGLKDADHFVRSRGGRIAIKEPLDEESVKQEGADDADEGKAKPPKAKDAAKEPAAPDPTPKIAARKSKKGEKVPAMSASVADRLTKELNALADRIDDLVDEIAKYSNQPMDQPIQASVSEGFANFSSW